MKINFEETKLKNLVKKIRAGGTPPSTVQKFYNGEIPFVSIEDITNTKKFLNSTKKYLSQEGIMNSSAWVVPSGFLIYSMYASVGKIRILNKDAATSQAIIAFDTNEKNRQRISLLFFRKFGRKSL